MHTISIESSKYERGSEHDVEGVEDVEGDGFGSQEVGEVGKHFVCEVNLFGCMLGLVVSNELVVEVVVVLNGGGY